MDKNKTPLQELIKEFETIKTNCKTLQEALFFDGILAVIDGYVEKEKETIIIAFNDGYSQGYFDGQSLDYDPQEHEYYKEKFNQ